ncbi:hypothetical protein IJM86_03095 [bacterium]|nr:hypothetical protein [bacterium]
MNQKEIIYEKILKTCNRLSIAKYLKNEIKESLKYFHTYKLQNIQKNLSFLKKYLLYLNKENCKNIEELEISSLKQHVNNQLKYFYNKSHFSKEDQIIIKKKIESNRYKMITMIQGIKGLLLLTIDEICNASPTRMDINTLLLQEKTKKI